MFLWSVRCCCCFQQGAYFNVGHLWFSNCVFCRLYLPDLWGMLDWVFHGSFSLNSELLEVGACQTPLSWEPVTNLRWSFIFPPNTWCCSFYIYISPPCWGASVFQPAATLLCSLLALRSCTVQLSFQNLFLPLRNSKKPRWKSPVQSGHLCALHCMNYSNPAREESWELFSLETFSSGDESFPASLRFTSSTFFFFNYYYLNNFSSHFDKTVWGSLSVLPVSAWLPPSFPAVQRHFD